MKKEGHPKFNEVIFKDVSCGFVYKTFSTLSSNEMEKWEDGQEYPVIKVGISSASHPFYTGQQKIASAEGRAAKFKKKYSRKK
ncbi:MAG: type B 50S ribosomal protein L31 [Bdellovibrionales bacterium]|nr:type B 50S ribosomal protein L31 [Bdellovibrionales bacterium]